MKNVINFLASISVIGYLFNSNVTLNAQTISDYEGVYEVLSITSRDEYGMNNIYNYSTINESSSITGIILVEKEDSSLIGSLILDEYTGLGIIDASLQKNNELSGFFWILGFHEQNGKIPITLSFEESLEQLNIQFLSKDIHPEVTFYKIFSGLEREPISIQLVGRKTSQDIVFNQYVPPTDMFESEAIRTLASISRGQQAFFLEQENFAVSINDLSLGIEEETRNYIYQMLLKPEYSMVVKMAFPKNDELRAILGVTVYNSSEDTTESIVCIPDERTSQFPDLPLWRSGKLECAEGSSKADL